MWAWILALALVAIIIVGVWDYRSSVQEYTFARPSSSSELGNVLREKTPVAIQIGALPDTEEFTTGLSDIADARALWWLPGLWNVQRQQQGPGLLSGLEWVAAERQWIGCSSGAPLKIWLVHSRYRRFLESADGSDPWTLTKEHAPWISRVQCIEAIIKPGWAYGIPTHWGIAVKNEGQTDLWRAQQHSALSWALTT